MTYTIKEPKYPMKDSAVSPATLLLQSCDECLKFIDEVQQEWADNNESEAWSGELGWIYLLFRFETFYNHQQHSTAKEFKERGNYAKAYYQAYYEVA